MQSVYCSHKSPDMLGSGRFLFSSSERKITLYSLSLFAQLYSLHFLPRQHLLGNTAGEARLCGAEPHFDGWRRRSPICTVAAGEVGTVWHIIPHKPGSVPLCHMQSQTAGSDWHKAGVMLALYDE